MNQPPLRVQSRDARVRVQLAVLELHADLQHDLDLAARTLTATATAAGIATATGIATGGCGSRVLFGILLALEFLAQRLLLGGRARVKKVRDDAVGGEQPPPLSGREREVTRAGWVRWWSLNKGQLVNKGKGLE